MTSPYASDEDMFDTPQKDKTNCRQTDCGNSEIVDKVNEREVQQIEELLNRLKGGIPPPPETTELGAHELLKLWEENKHLALTKDDLKDIAPSENNSRKNFDSCNYTSDKTEQFQQLLLKYQQKFVSCETGSVTRASNFKTTEQLTLSEKKRARQNGWAVSPKTRVSYLKKRRQVFGRGSTLGSQPRRLLFVPTDDSKKEANDGDVKGRRTKSIPKRSLFTSPEGKNDRERSLSSKASEAGKAKLESRSKKLIRTSKTNPAGSLPGLNKLPSKPVVVVEKFPSTTRKRVLENITHDLQVAKKMKASSEEEASTSRPLESGESSSKCNNGIDQVETYSDSQVIYLTDDVKAKFNLKKDKITLGEWNRLSPNKQPSKAVVQLCKLAEDKNFILNNRFLCNFGGESNLPDDNSSISSVSEASTSRIIYERNDYSDDDILSVVTSHHFDEIVDQYGGYSRPGRGDTGSVISGKGRRGTNGTYSFDIVESDGQSGIIALYEKPVAKFIRVKRPNHVQCTVPESRAFQFVYIPDDQNDFPVKPRFSRIFIDAQTLRKPLPKGVPGPMTVMVFYSSKLERYCLYTPHALIGNLSTNDLSKITSKTTEIVDCFVHNYFIPEPMDVIEPFRGFEESDMYEPDSPDSSILVDYSSKIDFDEYFFTNVLSKPYKYKLLKSRPPWLSFNRGVLADLESDKRIMLELLPRTQIADEYTVIVVSETASRVSMVIPPAIVKMFPDKLHAFKSVSDHILNFAEV